MLDNILDSFRNMNTWAKKTLLITTLAATTFIASNCGIFNPTPITEEPQQQQDQPKEEPEENKPPYIIADNQSYRQHNLKEQNFKIPIEIYDEYPSSLDVKVSTLDKGIKASLNKADIQPDIKKEETKENQIKSSYTIDFTIEKGISGKKGLKISVEDNKKQIAEKNIYANIAENKAPKFNYHAILSSNEGFYSKDVDFKGGSISDPENDSFSISLEGNENIKVEDIDKTTKRITVEDKDYNTLYDTISLPITITDERGSSTKGEFDIRIFPMLDYSGNSKDIFTFSDLSDVKVTLEDHLGNEVVSTYTDSNGNFSLEDATRQIGIELDYILKFSHKDYLERTIPVENRDNRNVNETIIPLSWANQTFKTRDGSIITKEDAMNILLRWFPSSFGKHGIITKFSWDKVIFYKGDESLFTGPFSREKIDDIKTALEDTLVLYAPEKKLGKDIEWIEVDNLEGMEKYVDSHVFTDRGLRFREKPGNLIIYGRAAGFIHGCGSILYEIKDNYIISSVISIDSACGIRTYLQEIGTATGGGNGSPLTNFPKPEDDPFNSTVYDEQEAAFEFTQLDKELSHVYLNRKPGEASGTN